MRQGSPGLGCVVPYLSVCRSEVLGGRAGASIVVKGGPRLFSACGPRMAGFPGWVGQVRRVRRAGPEVEWLPSS